MAEVWNDATAKTALVIAPPGSGKENLASSAYHLRRSRRKSRRKNEIVRGLLVTSSLSPYNALLNEKQLISIESNCVLPPAYATLTGTGDGRPDAGLLLKALGGTLFLDEIDKCPVETRSGLLRILESETLVEPNSGRILSLKRVAPYYVFAGSKPRNEMFSLEPRDFWTRISHVIEMRHPLGLEGDQHRLFVLQEYFQMFWNRHVPNYIGHSKGTGRFPFAETEASAKIQEYYGHVLCFMISRTVTLFVSRCFASDAMAIAPIETLSIRNIRTIVQKVCYDIFEVLVHPKRFHGGLSDLQRGLSESKSRSFGFPWFLLLEFALTPEEGWTALMRHLREEGELETFYEKKVVDMIPPPPTEQGDEDPKVIKFKTLLSG